MDTNAAPPLNAMTGDSTPPEPHRAAANLLEMAARDADIWRREAKAEADALVKGARVEAANLVRDGQAQADQLTTTARSQADRLLVGARTEAERIRAENDAAIHAQQAELARLRQLEDDTRSRLHDQLTALLAQIDTTPSNQA